ncbi:MAG: MBL fold metallo-hydrolase, partial [Lachnospiraceae bacterium]
MFKMFREFCAVGQGAFYRETFKGHGENINVIYDCGASPCKKCVKREIERVFKKGEIIHALFISHFHEDHVNGIPFLIQYCNVKRIFFPLLSEKNKILLKIKLYIEDKDSFAYKFIEDPKKAIGNIEKESLDYNEPILIGVLEGERRNDVEQINVE